MSEVQRVLNVIEETVRDVEILTYLPNYVSQIPADVMNQLNPTIQKALTGLYEAERELEGVFSQSKPSEIQEAAQKVKNAAKLLAHLIGKYNCVQVFKTKVAQTKQEELLTPQKSEFGSTLRVHRASLRKTSVKSDVPSPMNQKKTLQDGLTQSASMLRFYEIAKQMKEVYWDKLHTTMEEEQMRNDQKNETAAREKKASADLKALQRELAAETSFREREVSLKDAALQKLKEELDRMNATSSAETKEFEQYMNEKESLSVVRFQMQEKELLTKITKKKMELAQLRDKHSRDEKELKVKRKNNEETVEDHIKKYDKAMFETTVAIAKLEAEFTEDEKKVKFYREELLRLAEEKKRREEELRKQVDAKRAEEKLRQEFVQKVIRIQRCWRRFLQAKAEAKKSKKKPKKPKKKEGTTSRLSGTNRTSASATRTSTRQ